MKTSLLELFKIGIGPSSSHTVGPMRAARRFVEELNASGKLANVHRVQVDLYGSLALTGHGHGTDRAILLGLMGEIPERIEPETVDPRIAAIREKHALQLFGRREIGFTEGTDLLFHKTQTCLLYTSERNLKPFDENQSA